MCRLAYVPGKADVKFSELVNLFKALEKSCGGDGNGYVAVSPEGQIFSNKGVKLTPNTIVKHTYRLIQDGWSLYFHTRKVSVGWIDDDQCHPFEIRGKAFKGWMCHNGTWGDGSVMAKYFGCGSDTAAFARLIGQFGLKKLKEIKLFPLSGVFLLYGNRPSEVPMHRVLHIWGDLEYCPHTGIWASEFPGEWKHWNDTYNVDYGRHMLNKTPPKRIAAAGWVNTPTGCTYRPASSVGSSKPRYGMYASDMISKDHEDLFSYKKYDDEDIPSQEDVENHFTQVDRNLLS